MLNNYFTKLKNSGHSGTMILSLTCTFIFIIISILLSNSNDILYAISIIFFIAAVISLIMFFVAFGSFMEIIYDEEN